MRALLPIALFLCPPAQATTLLDWGVSELTANSELVFLGRVVDQRTRIERDGRGVRLWTDTTFAIDETWKGAAPVALTLTQPGGEAAGRRALVHGQASFTEGEAVVVFVERADTGALVVCGMALGKYAVVGATASRRPFGLHRVERPLRFEGVPDDDRMPLAALRARVRALATPRVVRPDTDRALPRVAR